jgi:hypothetical protein
VPAWLAWTGGIGGIVAVLGLIAALVKLRPEMRKLNAEAASLLVKSATEYSTGVVAEVKELKGEVRQQGETQRKHERLLRVHHHWDEKVVDVVRSLGGNIDDPPPLYLEG